MLAMSYRVFAYLGLGSIAGSLLHGFRHAPDAPAANYVFDAALYTAWAVVHLLMTRTWFKRALYGTAHGSLFERQIYITVSVTTWWLVIAYHRPVPGFVFELPELVAFLGAVGFVLSIFAFFEGATFAHIDALLGVPGTRITHTHGAETPLLTEGQYARVRHPMYRAALLTGLCSFLLHPHAAQLLWCILIGVTFVGFIPIEERQLLAARGDAYRTYMQVTRWRLFRGVW